MELFCIDVTLYKLNIKNLDILIDENAKVYTGLDYAESAFREAIQPYIEDEDYDVITYEGDGFPYEDTILAATIKGDSFIFLIDLFQIC